MTTVTEALDRLKIVKAATEGAPNSALASIEAVTAVSGFLEAILEETLECECVRCSLVHALALDSLAIGVMLPLVVEVKGRDSVFMDRLFLAFAHGVEALIDLYDEEPHL